MEKGYPQRLPELQCTHWCEHTKVSSLFPGEDILGSRQGPVTPSHPHGTLRLCLTKSSQEPYEICILNTILHKRAETWRGDVIYLVP